MDSSRCERQTKRGITSQSKPASAEFADHRGSRAQLVQTNKRTLDFLVQAQRFGRRHKTAANLAKQSQPCGFGKPANSAADRRLADTQEVGGSICAAHPHNGIECLKFSQMHDNTNA
ncbi:hypothetical protein GCM10023067_58080 [Aminobacter aganoensis]